MKQKKSFALLGLMLMAAVMFAQSPLSEGTFTDLYSGLLVVVSTALTFLAKNQIVKAFDDNAVERILKNTWVLSGIVFVVVAYVFVTFGLSAANVMLAVKFIGTNLLAVVWSSFKTPTDTKA